MLLELAIGDALGAGYEYVSDFRVAEGNDGKTYRQHPSHMTLPPGHYTDDTQMSIAIAEVMLADVAWTPLALADSFVRCFRRDPRDGYARKFQAFLESVETGKEFLDGRAAYAKIYPASDRSGAAMRAAPIGLYRDIGDVMKRCRIQAVLTHDTDPGVYAAMASSLLTHYFAYGYGPKEEVGFFISRYVPGPWEYSYIGKVGMKGWQSAQAAITAVSKSSSMTELLKTCVAFTGDVDTVAAIAMPAGSLCTEIKQDLSPALYEGLENGAYGKDYIVDLDRRLLKKFLGHGE
jgi:ADP-ribosyl-[dinitrogen reductase] hydrolase